MATLPRSLVIIVMAIGWIVSGALLVLRHIVFESGIGEHRPYSNAIKSFENSFAHDPSVGVLRRLTSSAISLLLLYASALFCARWLLDGKAARWKFAMATTLLLTISLALACRLFTHYRHSLQTFSYVLSLAVVPLLVPAVDQLSYLSGVHEPALLLQETRRLVQLFWSPAHNNWLLSMQMCALYVGALGFVAFVTTVLLLGPFFIILLSSTFVRRVVQKLNGPKPRNPQLGT